MLKKKDKVKVFVDPITKKELEGVATLKNKIKEGDCGLELWNVSFVHVRRDGEDRRKKSREESEFPRWVDQEDLIAR